MIVGISIRFDLLSCSCNVCRQFADVCNLEALYHRRLYFLCTQVDVLPGDEFVLIACDGLWEVFTSQRAVDCVKRFFEDGNSPEARLSLTAMLFQLFIPFVYCSIAGVRIIHRLARAGRCGEAGGPCDQARLAGQHHRHHCPVAVM